MRNAYTPFNEVDPEIIAADVQRALGEDLGAEQKDLSALIIPSDRNLQGRIICREAGVLSGKAWADACFRRVSAQVKTQWLVENGQKLEAGTVLCTIAGPARAILTAERSALNFLQTLSATATATAYAVAQLKGTNTQLLDTRKTLPGLRMAQKKAVRDGGGVNHRVGLFDMILIKENHIAAAGSITQAVKTAARVAPDAPLQVEVETLNQLEEALSVGVRHILLDNFDIEQMHAAVRLTEQRATLEASGNIEAEQLQTIATTGVDFISSGALTKHVRALDLSLQVEEAQTA